MSKSLAIGPANYAGQANLWAVSCRNYSSVKAVSFGYAPTNSGFGFLVDRPIGELRRLGYPSMSATRNALADVDNVAIDGFLTLSGVAKFTSLERQIVGLRDAGKNVFLISHGTDTRDPKGHMRRVEWSYFRDARRSYFRRCQATSLRNRNMARRLGLQLLVSTPDLLLDNPDALWLPVVVDQPKWVTQSEAFERDRIRVIHVPSKTQPPIKGTVYIDPVLERLHSEGVIDYRRAESVAHHEMPDLIKNSDVVVDQILTGSYGVAAVEAMTAGRLVIGNVSNEVRSILPTEVPICDTTPSSLERLVRRIADSPEAYAEQARLGRKFAARVHDGRASASVLASQVR